MNKGAGGPQIVRPLLFLLLFFSTAPGRAAAVDNALARARYLRLWKDPQWLRLLHCKGGRSDALSEGFFLSPSGRHDSRAELETDVAAMYAVDASTGGRDFRCRFPEEGRRA